MAICHRNLLLTVGVCFVPFVVGGSPSNDATLPVVNVQFDFPIQDLDVGGPKQKADEDLVAFKARAQHLLDEVDDDAEVLTKFASTAGDSLNKLTTVLSKDHLPSSNFAKRFLRQGTMRGSFRE